MFKLSFHFKIFFFFFGVVPEGEIEGMETQAFLAPSTGPYSRRE